jgi:hypothetical protein
MTTKEKLSQFERTLQRIFTLNISRSTFREVQNAVVAAADGNKELAKTVFESLISGRLETTNLDTETQNQLTDIVAKYTVPVALCRDIHEKGEFIGLVTSDTLRQGELHAFLNRIRRIDGEEFQFITDVDQTLHLLLHWSGRLHELTSSEGGRQILKERKGALDAISSNLEQLASRPEARS